MHLDFCSFSSYIILTPDQIPWVGPNSVKKSIAATVLILHTRKGTRQISETLVHAWRLYF